MSAFLRTLLPLALAILASGVGAPDAARADETQWDQWRQQVVEARADVEHARQRHQAALGAYRQMRHRRRLRGESRAAVLTEVDASREGLAAAERRVEELVTSARRAGVPPRWLRAPRGSHGPASN